MRSELLSQRGVSTVSFEPTHNRLSIEYDPAIVDDFTLMLIMRRYGVCPEPASPKHGAAAWRRLRATENTPMTTTTNEWFETLKDGRRVLIRPIRRDDVHRNTAFIDSLSPPSKHFLFLGGVARLSDEAFAACAIPTTRTIWPIVALDARGGYQQRQSRRLSVRGNDATKGAEISVAVADDWQHCGLGKRLLSHLIDYARAHGVTSTVFDGLGCKQPNAQARARPWLQ